MKELDGDQRERLDAIRRAMAAEEPKLAAAIDEYNAAIGAAHDKFLELAAGYQRARDDFEGLHDDITFEMMDFAGEAEGDWQEGAEGRRYLDWLHDWTVINDGVKRFDRPRKLEAPDPPLSTAIAALPLAPAVAGAAGDPAAGSVPDPDPSSGQVRSATIRADWGRIAAWAAANIPAGEFRPAAGATQTQIDAAERILGFPLPDDVRESYRVHNGTDGTEFPYIGELSSIETVARDFAQRRSWDPDGWGTPDEIKGPIRPVWWDTSRVQLTDDGAGDGLTLDLNPAEGGTWGQVIHHDHERGPVGVYAASWGELLRLIADDAEAGRLVHDEDSTWRHLEPKEVDPTPLVVAAPPPPPPPQSGSVQGTSGSPPEGTVARRYFEFTGGTSNKFWEVFQEGSEMTTRYGKIGTGGQSKPKSFASPAQAAAEMAKIIAKKIKEGYVEQTSSGTVGGPSPLPGTTRPAASAGWSALADPEPMLGTVLPSASDRQRRLFAVACCRRVEEWLVGAYVLEFRDEHYRIAVATAERFADGKATSRELGEACDDADDSAFCNEWIEVATPDEMRKATYGNDAGWVDRARREMGDEDWEDMAALPDPATWFAIDDNDGNLPGGVDPFRDVAREDATLVGETIGRKVLLLVRHYAGVQREAEEKAAQAALVRDIFGDPFPPPAFDPAWRTPDVTALARSIDENRAFDRMPALAAALEEAGCDHPVILGHCRGPGPHVRGCWALDLVLGRE